MGKINTLSPEVCNRIAAGEVIERPFSAVKEMVENSIDAGATEIEISIENGGKTLIKIVDNGCGIEKEDMRAAFFAHATSKISSLEDIDHIHTLGFRGEALATIASIAHVELISCVEGGEANKVICDDQYIGAVQPAVAERGTQIFVTKFFYNTPARYKFMKSDKKEEADITAYVTRYILGNPQISFKYYTDGKLRLQSFGGGLEEAITQVYGARVLPDCFKISAERNGIKISGFISNQNFYKTNKTYQTTFLNGRYISNAVITSAIANAYTPYLVKRQYPFYVLNIEMSDENVDINVHPNKQDVRFIDNSLVYGTVYKVISSILDGTAKAADFVVNAPAEKPVQGDVFAAEYKCEPVEDRDFSGVVGIESYLSKGAAPERADNGKAAESELYKSNPAVAEPEYFAMPDDVKNSPPDDPRREITTIDYIKLHEGDSREVSLCSNGGYTAEEYRIMEKEKKSLQQMQANIDYLQCKYRGTLFNTYLLYELRNDVYMIDQHAAHERLLYDKLQEKLKNRTIARQPMLEPYVFSANPSECLFVDENLDMLWEMGFSVEKFGTSAYRVYEIPTDLMYLNVAEFFSDYLANVEEMKKISYADMVKDKIAQTACKHAIKGGDVLTDEERTKLFDMLYGNMGLKCPHGRPICVKLTRYEIEKMFKRKV